MYPSTSIAGLRLGPAFYFLLACLIAFAIPHGKVNARTEQLPVQELVVDSHRIRAEIAATPKTRNQGLMHRESLPQDTGMLFVFEEAGQPCFWMKNTVVPLSIAFIDPSGYIVNIADMEPLDLSSHCPAAPILYALEMEQGWFGSKEIRAGARVEHLPPAH